jgi:hypothetical protein
MCVDEKSIPFRTERSARSGECSTARHAPARKSGLTLIDSQRDGNGKPYVLPTVLKAEEIVFNAKLDKEYLPITVGRHDSCLL